MTSAKILFVFDGADSGVDPAKLFEVLTYFGAISRQSSVAAVRFPSAALGASGRKGWNLAIFPGKVRSPPVAALAALRSRQTIASRGKEPAGPCSQTRRGTFAE